MPAALLNICVDPRLNHDALRQQLRQRGLTADVPDSRIFVVADAAGNIGSAARNTIRLLKALREQVVLAGVLHHDDCLAASQGMGAPIEASAAALRDALAQAGMAPPILTGRILTASSSIVWDDQPAQSLETLRFRMPRMYGQ
jgi:hypothetical protein